MSVSCYSSYLALNSYLTDSSRYNPNLAPAISSTSSSATDTTLTISVVFLLVKFVSLHSDTQTMTVAGALDMLWTDPQLQWTQSSYPCVENMPFNASSVWHPYVFLKSSAGPHFRYDMYDNDIIHKNGAAGQSNGRIYGEFKSSCTMNLLYYPFDSQTCSLYFVNYDATWISWSTSGPVYHMSSDAASNRDWSISSVTSNTTSSNLCVASGCNDLSIFYVTFSLARKYSYYSMTLIAPTVVLWVMIALTFLLPTDRGMKVPMTVTLMLTVYTQQRNVTNLLPAASPTPFIALVYLYCLYLSALSLITAVLTVLMRVLAPKLPPGAQRFILYKVGRLCCAPKPPVEAEPWKCIGRHDAGASTDAESKMTTGLLKADSNKDNVLLSTLETHFVRLEQHMCALIEMKQAKTAKAQAAALNESVWQKIEFIFNGILLFVYTAVMIYVFATYTTNVSHSIL